MTSVNSLNKVNVTANCVRQNAQPLQEKSSNSVSTGHSAYGNNGLSSKLSLNYRDNLLFGMKPLPGHSAERISSKNTLAVASDLSEKIETKLKGLLPSKEDLRLEKVMVKNDGNTSRIDSIVITSANKVAPGGREVTTVKVEEDLGKSITFNYKNSNVPFDKQVSNALLKGLSAEN